jgi:mRNA interferase RelE/StbE
MPMLEYLDLSCNTLNENIRLIRAHHPSCMHWKISYTPHFNEKFRLLPSKVQKMARDVFDLVIEDPFHPNLRTHILQRRLANYHSISVDSNYRIICRIFESRREVVLHDTGTHEIYRSFLEN